MTDELHFTITADGEVVHREIIHCTPATFAVVEDMANGHHAIATAHAQAGKHVVLTIVDPDGVLPPHRITVERDPAANN